MRTIRATLIHGKTFKEVERCDLPVPEFSFVDEGAFPGERSLLIDGYRFVVKDADWVDLKKKYPYFGKVKVKKVKKPTTGGGDAG